MLKKPRGIAWDLPILHDAEKAGCTETEVVDLDDDTIYTAPLSAFREHGIPIDRGYGRQVALPLAYWRAQRRSGPRQMELGL